MKTQMDIQNLNQEFDDSNNKDFKNNMKDKIKDLYIHQDLTQEKIPRKEPKPIKPYI